MEAGQSWKTINSEALNRCFDFEITTTFSKDSFAESLLDGIDFENLLDDIKSLSRTLVLERAIQMDLNEIKPGTVFCFDVDVVCESENLKVIERVSIWLYIYKGKLSFIITQHSRDWSRLCPWHHIRIHVILKKRLIKTVEKSYNCKFLLFVKSNNSQTRHNTYKDALINTCIIYDWVQESDAFSRK